MTIDHRRDELVADLIDSEEGLVSRRLFVDDDIYQQEQERIFARCWQFMGHESQIPTTGDFFTTYLGEDSVVVCRQDDGTIGAWLNVCRHRGMRICKLDAGNAAGFSCSYHGWAYDRSGKLVDVPFAEMYDNVPLNDGNWGAMPVAQVDSYKGLIFGTFDAEAPPLLEYLGDMAFYLDALVDRVDGGSELYGGCIKWIIDCNWKYGAENFVQDGHHAFVSHIAALMAMQPDDADEIQFSEGWTAAPGNGHGLVGFHDPTTELLTQDPVLLDWHQNVIRKQSACRLGPNRDRLHNIAAHTVFPNFSFLTGFQTIRLWLPRGPNHMELRTWCIVDKAAPKAVKDAQLKFCRTTFSASGLLEQDDGENWSMCQDTLRGFKSRELITNVRMGMGRSTESELGWPGKVMEGWNEEPGRDFFRRYRQLMSDPTPGVWANRHPFGKNGQG